jgi:hypothetical protein
MTKWFYTHILLFFLPFVMFSGEIDEKQMNVAMRMLGHELLLSSSDSTSRVLPVQRFINAYQIRFSSALAISPDSLYIIAQRLRRQQLIPNQYILEVFKCDSLTSSTPVYAFSEGQAGIDSIVPCIGRDLPKACYTLIFTDLTFMGQETAAVEENERSWLGLLFSGLALLLSGIAIYWYRKNQSKTTSNPNLIAIGKYHFDKLNSELIIKEQRIELTSKEADLLFLLYETANQTLERDVILNKVWGDEGDYIGRTLDVFISKLRKKLEFDTSVKIVNVRGVGYKLVLAG